MSQPTQLRYRSFAHSPTDGLIAAPALKQRAPPDGDFGQPVSLRVYNGSEVLAWLAFAAADLG
ncbi:MAG: hypothetical protein IPO15_08935 [Anaerolineae bacterium]|uniref:hypothetical protein n=1 Tax=Candidatus Amarolinea dominans TaxID=3140696 RepID=UPI0031363605|nr:hypothetical protein [Anaerolineae bacterium]